MTKSELNLPKDIQLLEPNPQCLKEGHLCGQQNFNDKIRRICLIPKNEALKIDDASFTKIFEIKPCGKSGNKEALVIEG